ncbi:glycosyltransferase family 2 protein [Flavobacteriaceae bacterium TK19130]|nr:glycosyltransferase family 2 protein [Thermobacterium salinum]
MTLSVVILNYNVRYFLEQCILSVERALMGIDSEIIVIDNDSSDDSCAMVKEKFPSVILLENKENVGFSKANNQAVAIAKGEYICILNPDTAVSENSFSKCIATLEDQHDLGAIGVKLIDGTGCFLPESKRNLPTPKASLLKLLGKGDKYYASHIPVEGSGNVRVLVGAFMFMRRSVYEEVIGFDEDYFMYGEDIDLSYKIEKAGYKNLYLGATEVLHYKGESTAKDAVYLERFHNAMKIFYKKHFRTTKVMDMAVNVGVTLAKYRKGKRTATPKPLPEPETIFVLTENLALLSKVKHVVSGEVKSASKSIFQDTIPTNSQFIFDVTYMSYSQIFQVMQQLSKHGNTFRIIPDGSDFMLGSDRSDEKGTVTVF